jgi:hypothetical protein
MVAWCAMESNNAQEHPLGESPEKETSFEEQLIAETKQGCRFRLITLFLFVTGSCVATAWFANKWRTDEERWKASEAIEKTIPGSHVDFRTYLGNFHIQGISFSSVSDEELRKLMEDHERFFDTVEQLHVENTRLTKDGFALLPEMKKLRWIMLQNAESVTVDDLTPLQGMQHLQFLYLQNTAITADDIEALLPGVAYSNSTVSLPFMTQERYEYYKHHLEAERNLHE